MVFTRKFSQFFVGGAQTPSDEVVGLRAVQNTIFDAGGSGSGGGVTQIIIQPTAGLAVGNWLRINSSGLYVLALADGAQDAEVVGVVLNIIDANSFTLQQSGYITTSSAVFSGLTASNVYFLSTATLGLMVNVDATVNNTVSRPVFVADSATSGWVLPYRGLIVGGPSPGGGGGNMGLGITWNIVSVGGTVNMSPFNGYIITAATLVTLNMPASFNVGDLIVIYNFGSGGYQVKVGASQYIQYAGVKTTTSTGSISSTVLGDSLMMIGLIPTVAMGVISSTGNQVEV